MQSIIKKKYGQDATNVGDEGGFAPNIQVMSICFSLLLSLASTTILTFIYFLKLSSILFKMIRT